MKLLQKEIDKKLGDDTELKPFTYQIVDILPDELHQQHQHRKGEGEEQGPDEGAEDETIDFLHCVSALSVSELGELEVL